MGATNLQAKLGSEFAASGAQCWITDTRIRQRVKRWDGRPYHRESIGRARRQMAKAGWIGCVRIYPQQKPPGASLPSAHGTTSKWICWSALGVRDPLTRGERRKVREERRKTEREIQWQEERLWSPAKRAFFATIDDMFLSPMGSRKPERKPSSTPERERERQEAAEKRAAEARAWLRAHPPDDEPPPERGPP